MTNTLTIYGTLKSSGVDQSTLFRKSKRQPRQEEDTDPEAVISPNVAPPSLLKKVYRAAGAAFYRQKQPKVAPPEDFDRYRVHCV